MRTVESKYNPEYKEHYLYPKDLEEFKTIDLIYLLRKCRAHLMRMSEMYPYEEFQKKLENPDNIWVNYSWDHTNSWYTMIWMVKDVLSRREHIIKDKKERKKIRQEKAKHKQS